MSRADLLRKRASIGVLTALPKEAAAFRLMLEHEILCPSPQPRTQRNYYVGEVPSSNGGVHVVAVALLPDMGNNSAAVSATQLLTSFPNVRHVIMCGIAGGIPRFGESEHDVRLGDIVVSNRNGIVQYDLVKERPDATREHRHPPRPPGADLLSAVRHLQADELFCRRPWEEHLGRGAQINFTRPDDNVDARGDHIEYPEDGERRKGWPRVFTGVVAASNTLLKNHELRDYLGETFGAKAVEMEGSGIADATWDAQSGYLVVRGVCDYCDDKKGDRWQAAAAVAAAAYCRSVIEAMPSTPHSSSVNQDDASTSHPVSSDHAPLSNTKRNAISIARGIKRGLIYHESPVDLWTPGHSTSQVLASYEPIVGQTVAERLSLEAEAAVAATIQGDFRSQVEIAQRVRGLAPDSPYLQAEADYLEAEGLRLLADTAPESEQTVLRRKALAMYERCQEALPDDPRPVRGIGRTHEVFGDLARAEKYFRRAQALCLLAEPASRTEMAHESLRISRHLIHCLLEMRRTSQASDWNREQKTLELEGMLVQCHNLHLQHMPLFASDPAWSRIEWFMGLLFIAKAWGELGNEGEARRHLTDALAARRYLIPAQGSLTAVEDSNLRWWLSVAEERIPAADQRTRAYYRKIAEAATRRDRGDLHRLFVDFLQPHVVPWEFTGHPSSPDLTEEKL